MKGRFSAGLGGVLCVVGTVVLGVLLPDFRRYRSDHPEPDVPAADVGHLQEHLHQGP